MQLFASSRSARLILLACAFIFLTACGGGGGGETGNPPSSGGGTNNPPSGGGTNNPPPTGGGETPAPNPPSGGGETPNPPSGGGTPNPPSSSTFSVALDRNSVSFDYVQGTLPGTQTVIATGGGEAPDPLYVSAIVEGEGIDPVIAVTLNGTQASIPLRPRTGLTVGTYSGRVLMLACSDQACTNRIGGTPLAVSYTITVRDVLSFTPSPVTMVAASGDPATQTVTVRVPSGAEFRAAIDGSPEWLSITNQTATGFELTARALPPGTYRATLRVTAGTEVAFSTVLFQSLAPPQLSLTAVSGQHASGEVAAPLAVGASSYSAIVSQGQQWLSITSQQPGRFAIEARSLPAGEYLGTIAISSGLSTYIRSVQYRVTAPPGGQRELSVSPENATLTTVEGATSEPVQLAVAMPSWNSQLQASTTYRSGSDWLTHTATPSGYALTANAANLTAGTYTAVFSIHPGWPRGPINIPVALTVGIGLARPADTVKSVDAETVLGDLAGTVPIDVVAGPVAQWTAVADQPWLHITRSAGDTGGTMSYRIDTTALNGFSNFSVQTAHVTITPANPTMTPVSFSIQVDKRIPEVTGLGPFYVITDRPDRVFIRGRGFSAIGDIDARLRFDGSALTNVRVVNDTQIVAMLPVSSVGQHAIRVSNALNLDTEQRSLTYVDPVDYTYMSMATGGPIRTLVHDAARQSVYAVNVGLHSLQRFRLGGSIQIDSVPIPQILDAGLMNLGASLAVTASDPAGTLRLIDPTTLTTQSTHFNEIGFTRIRANESQGIPVTNDGRIYLASRFLPGDSGQWSDMGYFDPHMNAFRGVIASFMTYFHSGPWFAVSRDGERMLITQSASLSPAPPMLYMNAADSTLRINPAGINWFYHATMSDDGNRVLYDSNDVLDSEFQFIGRVVIPDAHTNWFALSQARAMSPDGNRAYVLAYHEDDLAEYSPPATPIHTPRVYVFDTSTRQVNEPNLPLLGYFTVPEYASCRAFYTCDVTPRAAISPDGRTLFFAGSERFQVVPIPRTLTPASVSSPMQAQPTQAQKSAPVTQQQTPVVRWKFGER